MTPGCIAVCSWRPVGPPPVPLTLSLNPVPPQAAAPIGLSPPCALPLPLPGLPHPPYTPFLSLGRLCQRSPRTVPVSLLRVGSTRRRAPALAGLGGAAELHRDHGADALGRAGGKFCTGIISPEKFFGSNTPPPFPLLLPGGRGLVQTQFGMAKVGVVKIWHEMLNTMEKCCTTFPDSGHPRN